MKAFFLPWRSARRPKKRRRQPELRANAETSHCSLSGSIRRDCPRDGRAMAVDVFVAAFWTVSYLMSGSILAAD